MATELERTAHHEAGHFVARHELLPELNQDFISIEPDEAPARHTVEEIGCDHLVFSTDYPHGDSKYPHAVESFLKLSLSDEDKRKILWDNCARFYGASDTKNSITNNLNQQPLNE